MNDRYSNLLPTDDDERAELALRELLRILYGPAHARVRQRAANLILKYCCPLPIQRAHLKIEDATGWLDGLMELDDNDTE